MKTFEYVRAHSVDEAIQMKAGDPQCRFLGGGTNLIDLMKYNVESPTKLIDISHLPLNKIEETPNHGLRIGALVRNSDLAEDPRVLRYFPVLSQALLNGASPQLRNMATIGGNLLQRTRCYYFYDTAFPCNKREPGSGCSAINGYNRIHAILGHSESCIAVNPSDMSVALALLKATVNVKGASGERAIPIEEFHRLPGDTPQFDTTLKPDEVILGVEIPPDPIMWKSSYTKIRDRQTYAFALASVALAVDMDDVILKRMDIVLGGVAHKPWRVEKTGQMLQGKRIKLKALREAAAAGLADAKAFEHNAFKIQLASQAIVRAVVNLAGGAEIHD